MPSKKRTEKVKTQEVTENKTNSQVYTFGSNAKLSKGKVITSPLPYTLNTGYGFDTASNVKINATNFYTQKPTYFLVALPEGNYKVEVTIGFRN